jgi:hypothetical protein
VKRIAWVLLLLLSGCIAPGPVFVAAEAPSSDQALIYVYRINDQFGQMVPTQIIINGNEVAKLPDNAYTFAHVPAGAFKLFATRFMDFNYSEKRRVAVEALVSGGETYFFKVRTVAGPMAIVTYVSVEPPEQGKKDLQTLHLSALSK